MNNHLSKHIGQQLIIRIVELQAQSHRTGGTVQGGVDVIDLAIPGFTGQIIQGHGNFRPFFDEGGLSFKYFRFYPDPIQVADTEQSRSGLNIKAFPDI